MFSDSRSSIKHFLNILPFDFSTAVYHILPPNKCSPPPTEISSDFFFFLTKKSLDESERGKIMASGPITSGKWLGKQWKQWLTLFFGAPKSLQMVIAAMKLKDAFSLEGKL